MKKTVVHIIPSGVFSNNYHGSYKDTISRVDFLQSIGANYIQILLDDDAPLVAHASIPDSESIAFLVEYSTMPEVVRSIRMRFPEAFIAVRSHNLEPMQHFDNHGWWPRGKGFVWMGYGMARLLRNDLIVKSHSSVIWSISDWENRVYWNRLPGKAKSVWLPYHCPDHLLPRTIVPVPERRRIVCMPTSQKNRKSFDLVTRFVSFAEQIQRHTEDRFEFLVTGNLSNWGLRESPVVSFTGMIDDLRGFLQSVCAVAMLSDKGYGFKTTIGDAIAHGAFVLAHPKLKRRCPEVLNPAILAVDSNNPSDINAVVRMLRTPGSFDRLDADLRKNAVCILGEAYA